MLEIVCQKCSAVIKLDGTNQYPLACPHCAEPSPTLLELDRCNWATGMEPDPEDAA